MAKYRITSPTGEKFEITAPDDATEEQVMSYAQQQFSQQQPKQEQSQSDFDRMVSNIPSSAAQFGKDLIQPILHPLDTAESMAQLFFGLGDKATGMQSPGVNPQVVDAVGQFMKERYIDSPRESFIQDPVGMGSDVLGLLAGGGALAAKVPGQVGRYGALINRAANIADPINIVGKAGGSAKRAIQKGATELIGETTGVGGGAAERAINRSDDFKTGLKGEKTAKEVVDDAKSLMHQLSEKKRQSYLTNMENAEGFANTADLSNIQRSLRESFDNFGVSGRIGDDGSLFLERGRNTKLDKAGISELNNIYDEIAGWQKRVGDNVTYKDLDNLKGLLDKTYSENSDVRAFVAKVRKSISNELNANVDGYASAMSEYQKYLDIEHDLKALSLTDKASTDTTLKKLSSTFRKNFEGRTEAIKAAQEVGLDFDKVMDTVAGMQMSPLLARGLMGKMSITSGIAGTAAGIAGIVNPKIVLMLAGTSPRVMAQTLGFLGWNKKQINKFKASNGYKTFRKAYQGTGSRAATANVGRYSNLIQNELQPQE